MNENNNNNTTNEVDKNTDKNNNLNTDANTTNTNQTSNPTTTDNNTSIANKSSNDSDWKIGLILAACVILFFVFIGSCSSDGSTGDKYLDSYHEKVDTDDGVTTYTCDRCGETFVGEPAMYSDGEVFCALCKKDMEWAHAIVGDGDDDD